MSSIKLSLRVEASPTEHRGADRGAESGLKEEVQQGGRGGPDQMGDICSFHLGSLSEEPVKLMQFFFFSPL